jgi:preprotein translocase subunit SecA
MFNQIFTKLFGSRNDRLVKQMRKAIDQINGLESRFSALSDAELKACTETFRERHQKGETLDQLLPEAFAACREAARRSLGLRHYDVQLIGGMVLHQGKIAEMRTGEGKTLVATLAAYLNAIANQGVHVVTVNDYLARRDAAWMSPVYQALGLTVGVVVPGLPGAVKKAAYEADITYGTNNEYGFDYLRDNMAFSSADRMQRKPFFAIVDEVDSILIDEARTPLIISGPTDESPQLYVKINQIVPRLKRQTEENGPGDFGVDEKSKQVTLSEDGMETAERLLVADGILKDGESLYDAHNLNVVHHLNAALRAHALFRRDVEYIVKDGEVVIVDEFTGRTLAGRRWSDGLHQAIEAKEGVPIQRDNQTMASITFQNLFRLYPKLSGMTGTADTEAYEFQTIYGLEVVVIPTHRPMVRKDHVDVVYLRQKAKYDAILADIKDCYARKQPVLVGTTSIETSELLHGLLKNAGVPHEVLNAKQHEREAQIVAQAGRPGAVTIATNMAGRGTDIVLGGNLDSELKGLPTDATDSDRDALRAAWSERHKAVLEAGGLHIIGTERHESRRIDNQLRGRSGRQGDPGSSRFYLSLEDNLMRIFASDWVMAMMQRLGMKDDDVIQEKMAMRAIERAQRKIEAHNFDIRKQLLEYDDVANDQRKVIYEQRNHLMDAEEIAEMVREVKRDVVAQLVRKYVPIESIDEQWDLNGLETALSAELDLKVPVKSWVETSDELSSESILERVQEAASAAAQAKEDLAGSSEVMRRFEKQVMLMVLDSKWKDHLARMDYLRQGIHLRGYAQKQPMQEFKREAFELFSELLDDVKREVAQVLMRVRVQSPEEVAQVEERRRVAPPMQFQHAEAPVAAGDGDPEAEALAAFAPPAADPGGMGPFIREGAKVGRNDPCPCGSGKKYKQCHGKLA